MKYLIVIEPTPTGFSAYSPDLLECIATGTTREEVEKNMQESVKFHIEGLKLEGSTIPESATTSAYIEVTA